MEGIAFFTSLSENDSTQKDAYLVGKNLFNQQPSNESIFLSYFDFLCKFAEYPITIDERKFYANEADIALAYFSENVSITELSLQLIKKCKAQLGTIINDIIGIEKVLVQSALKEVQIKNAVELNNLVDLKGKLFLATKKSDFDSLLHSVQKCEISIEKKYLSQEQNELYDILTSEYSIIVNDKLIELERIENVEYNKSAVKSFKLVFDSFQSTEAKYKDNQSQLYSLVFENLFGYDAARLFNETLIYYNHVYSYIFNKLDDDGKYRLTQFSIDCEKLRRADDHLVTI